MIFRHTIINSFKVSQNPLLLLAAILNKKPPLSYHWPNLGSLSFGWQDFIEPTLAWVIQLLMGIYFNGNSATDWNYDSNVIIPFNLRNNYFIGHIHIAASGPRVVQWWLHLNPN